jgi:hypothetical protein
MALQRLSKATVAAHAYAPGRVVDLDRVAF